jgi:competence protein ComEA
MPAIAADKSDMNSNDKNTAVASEMQIQKTNINQATNKELAAIKGIGTKKAQAIIDYREAHGHFMDLNQLMKVKGIGQGTLKKITPYITL